MLDFDWAPSGDAIFFSGNARGIRNIWKISVDPKTLRWISGPEQITFSQGDDVAVAVSPDGKKLAFNMSTETTRLWTFPLVDGRVTGNPEPLTPEGWLPSDAGLTRDGRKLAFMARRRGERTGRYEVWQKELDDGSERLLLADSAPREELRWSPDGARLAYSRDAKITIYDTKTAEEQPLPSAAGRTVWVMDWSPDGTGITAG